MNDKEAVALRDQGFDILNTAIKNPSNADILCNADRFHIKNKQKMLLFNCELIFQTYIILMLITQCVYKYRQVKFKIY